MTAAPAVPSDTTSEGHLLGALLLNPDAYPAVRRVVDSSAFYKPTHADVFQAIGEMLDRGDTPTAHLLAEATGMTEADIFALESTGLPGREVTLARKVRRKAQQREALRASHRMREMALDDADPTEVAAVGTAALHGILTARGDDLADLIRNGADLDAQTFPAVVYHVRRLVAEGLSLLVGPPKIGKSWLVLLLALAVAAGGRALGAIPVAPRPVLYLALEDSDRRLQDRCRKLLTPGERIPSSFHYVTRVPPGEVVETVRAWLRTHPDGLVFLDTLGVVLPPARAGESSYQRDYRIGSQLKALVDEYPGTALVVVHHSRKADAEDFVDAVSGTHGLAGSADAIVVLSRQRHDSTGLLRVTGRDIPEGEYAVVLRDGVLWQLDGRDLDQAAAAAQQRRVSDGLDQRSREVIAHVTDNPEGVRAADLAAALDMDEHTARTYLARMAEGGRIARLSRGLYTPVASVASVANDQRNNATDATRNEHGLTLLDGGDGE